MASQGDKEDRIYELPSFLPPYEGKCVLELGDGGGCFTHELAEKNKRFECADINSPDLNFPDESMDLIFSNRLSTCLSDIEIKAIAQKMLKWGKVGGYILFREQCFYKAGEDEQKCCTQDVREPIFYIKVFKECHLSDASGNSFEFSLVGSKCIGTYELNKKNHNQIWWIWKKVNSKDDMGSQPFLDNVMYKNNDILLIQRIFGLGFMCIGGIDTTKEFVAMLDLKAGYKVLDVGCGTGGSAFYMADNFDVDVIGIDLSVNMISFALERAIGHKCVEFEVADCTKKSYPNNSFDVIYSRDVILHIQDKAALFRTFYKWLKPGGKVLISDYCFPEKAGTPSPDVVKLIKQIRSDLLDVEAYCQMFKNAGFQEVTTEDRTEQSKYEFQRHLKRLEKNKEELMEECSEEEYDEFVGSWKGNFARIDSVEQKYFICFAKKK